MVQCKTCGTQLAPNDSHTLCVVHRKCSRNSPCPLDEGCDTVYWDQLEAIRAAAFGVREKKVVKPKPKTGTGGKEKGKKGVVLKGLSMSSSQRKSRSSLDDNLPISKEQNMPSGNVATAKSVQGEGTNNGTSAVVPSVESPAPPIREVARSRPDVESPAPPVREVARSRQDETPGLPPGAVSRSPSSASAIQAGFGEVTDLIQTCNPRSVSTMASSAIYSEPRALDRDQVVITTQPRLEARAVNSLTGALPSSSIGQTTMNTGSAAVNTQCLPMQGVNPFMAMVNPFMLTQANALMQSGLWPNVNSQAYNSGWNTSTGVPPSPSVVVSQPASVSGAHSLSNTGETQFHRTSRTATRVRPPVARSDVQTQHSDTESDSDDSQSSDEEDSDQNQGGTTLDGDDDDDLSPPSKSSLKEVFNSDRIDPIVKMIAQNLDLSGSVDESEEAGYSLLFGGIGRGQSQSKPLIVLPQDFHLEKKKQAKSKWRKRPYGFFGKVFRVPKKDYESMFKVPAMDPEVVKLLPKGSAVKLDSYSRFWEQEMISLDAHMKDLIRLSAFQVLFLNHLLDVMDLSQDADQVAGPSATARLVVDMAGQQLRSGMALSFRTVSLRRVNACAYFREEFGKDLSSDLAELEFSDKHVFGGEFAKIVRKLAKKIRDKQTLESDLAAIPRGKAKGTTGTWKPFSDTPRSSSGVGRGRGAGRGRKRSRSRPSKRSSPAAAGGPPQAKKGRGRGGKPTQQRI